jgi:hypothetical protein
MTSISQPKSGSRRVAEWIYTVINPLIDALRREIGLLQERNLSWRYHSQRFEYIRLVREYIEPDAMPNLEDFLADNPAFDQKFESHDRNVATAEMRATAFYKMLIAAPIFDKDVNKAFQKYESTITPIQHDAPSLESIKAHLPKFVAENLINNAHELPAHYTIHSFWKTFADDFQKYLSEFEDYKGRESFRKVAQAADALKETSLNLLRDLESQRLTLCREFDVPAARPPVTVRGPVPDTLSS